MFTKERLLNNWHPMRIVRLAIGLYMAGGAVYMKDWMFGVVGTFFLYQALSDTSCCGAAGCSTPRRPSGATPPKSMEQIDVDYEEIK